MSSSLVIPYSPWGDAPRGVGQKAVHASWDTNIRVVMAGRQSGKTLTGVAEIVLWAMSAPDQVLWWMTPNYKVKDKAWSDLKEHIPKEVIAGRPLEQELKIPFNNGSAIWVKSADSNESLVSAKLHGLVGDEAGQWKRDVWYQGLLPMFNTTRLRVLFIGTPRGKNWFHELWLRGRQSGRYTPSPVRYENVTYHSFHWTSYDSPYKNLSVLAEAKRSSPADLFAQEYLAEPIENVQGVFKNISNAVQSVKAIPTDLNWLGIDLARKGDFSAYIGMNTRREVFHVERNQDDWPIQVQRIAALAFKTNARANVDATGLGDPVSQFIRDAGVNVKEEVLSNTNKQNIIDSLRLAFETGSITIPDDADLIEELESYEYEVLPSGRIRYSAPDGKHDDLVIALALANWGARSIPLGYSSKAVTHHYLPRTRGMVNL